MLVAGITEKNRFLRGLSPATRALFESHLTAHDGAIGDVLQQPDARIDAVWFPLSGLVSTLRPLEGDTNVEVDAVGSDGFLGLEIALGSTHCIDMWMVQSPGRFARLEENVFREAIERDPALRKAVRRYGTAIFAVRGQWIACNARHTIEQRLAKWLLATRDRVGQEIQITQDVVAMMLGVRRASVVTVLGRFVDEGLVAHGYARVRIVDDARLAEVSCPCYARVAELLRGAVG